jgi:hypothetical protein
MGFRNYESFNASYDEGRTRFTGWRKVPSQTTASGIWFDLSMSPGNPVPNYYAATPLQSKRMSQSADGGIAHGGNVSPLVKHLHRLTAISTTATAVPLPMIMCDYLMYYPFVDMADTSTLTIGVIDSVSQTLPRYTTGVGVQVMAVEVASQVGGTQFNITYTNSSGVAGRTSQTVRCNTQVVPGTIITTGVVGGASNAGPFIPLQRGDIGVRSIEGVTFLSNDVGLITLVLVKPLANLNVYDITGPAEKDFFHNTQSMPAIVDDAYLNFICYPSGTLAAAPILGTAEFVFSNS